MRIHAFQFGIALVLSALAQGPARAQTPVATAILEGLHADGSHYPEKQILEEAGLKLGDTVTRDQLQMAADRLGQLGLFSKVNYDFHTRVDGLSITFHLVDAPRVPVFFDNIPWFTDGELIEAIRKSVPLFDGTAPTEGSILDRIDEALRVLLTSRKLNVAVEHQVIANPLGEGTVLQFRINGASARIARLEFSDPQAASSRALQQHISDLVGKPYSRFAIDLFLTEHVRPVYLQLGYLRVKLGPPDIRLTGNPNQPLPDSLPAFIPVETGSVYRWQGVQWGGNSAISAAALSSVLAKKPGDVADGQAIEVGWDRVSEEYGRHGYLEAKLDPQALFDDQAHSVSYRVSVVEGPQYRCGNVIITGVSLPAEQRIRGAWPIPQAEVFDRLRYEEFLAKLDKRSTEIFGDLPIHYDQVGHWLRTDAKRGIVDVLLDFK